LRQDIPVVAVATKMDKVKRSQRAAHIQEVRQVLALPAEEPLVLFSSQDREGRDPLWQRLEAFLTPVVRLQGVRPS
jgi:GTP-binding protein